MPSTPPDQNGPEHFSVRTTLVLLIALLAAVGAGLLFHAGTHSAPLAILTSGGAFVAAWAFADHVIR